MIMNRSSEGRLLRKRGGTTEKLPEGASSPLLAKGNKEKLHKPKNMRMTAMVKKMSGSESHSGGLGGEPSMKDLGGTRKETNAGLPKKGAGFGIKRAAGGSTPKRDFGGFVRGANNVARYALDNIAPNIPVVGQVYSAAKAARGALQRAAGVTPEKLALKPGMLGYKRGGNAIARGKPDAPTGGTTQESYVNHGPRNDGKVDSRDPIQSAKGGKWIQKALEPSSKGKLHKNLGVPPGKKIPAAKMAKAEHSRNPTIRKEANLAHTLSGFRRGR